MIMKKILALVLALMLGAMPFAMAAEVDDSAVETPLLNSFGLSLEDLQNSAEFREWFVLGMFTDLHGRWSEGKGAGESEVFLKAFEDNMIYFSYMDLAVSWIGQVCCFDGEKVLKFIYSSSPFVPSTVSIDEEPAFENPEEYMTIFGDTYYRVDAVNVRALADELASQS